MATARTRRAETRPRVEDYAQALDDDHHVLASAPWIADPRCPERISGAACLASEADSIVAVATVAHPRLESAEYLALQAAAGWRSAVELIGGEAVVTPPSGGQSASAQGELFFAVRRWQESSGDAGLLLQDVFIRLSGENYLAPDIAWWAAARRPALAQGALDVVPDLVVEVLSPATRANDLGAKRDVYLAAGARELWLADPQSATVTAVRPDGRQQIVGHGDRLMCPLLPGFAVDVARVFLT